ncbi:hypothetical protein D9M71_345780 [compost metagenome]
MQGLLVDALPGEAQGHAVGHLGALEHLAHQVGGNAIDAIVAGKALAADGHVVGREVFGEQHHRLARAGEIAERQAAAQQQDKTLEHGGTGLLGNAKSAGA